MDDPWQRRVMASLGLRLILPVRGWMVCGPGVLCRLRRSRSFATTTARVSVGVEVTDCRLPLSAQLLLAPEHKLLHRFWNMIARKILTSLGVAASALFVSVGVARADWGALNMTEGVTQTSRDVYDLHMLIMWICVAIGVVVFGAMFYAMFKHRKSRGAVAAQFHESTTVEIVWTVIPFLILIGMAIPATSVLLDMADTSESDMTIKVTGYQWKWRYDYLDEGIGFYSTMAEDSYAARQLKSGIDPSEVDNYLLDVDQPLVIPAGKKVRILITAADVIHAWWVPDFGWKKDAIPGFINEAWTKVDQPGTYRGQCAELCGRDHGFMPVVVKVLPEPEYRAWLSAQKAADQIAVVSPH